MRQDSRYEYDILESVLLFAFTSNVVHLHVVIRSPSLQMNAVMFSLYFQKKRLGKLFQDLLETTESYKWFSGLLGQDSGFPWRDAMLAVVLNSSSCGRCFQPLTISECWKLVFPYNLTNCNAELNLSDICEYDLGGCDDANLTNDLNNCLGNLDVYRIVPCKAETLPQLNFTCSDATRTIKHAQAVAAARRNVTPGLIVIVVFPMATVPLASSAIFLLEARAEERLIGGDYCLLPLNCDSAQFEANCPSLASGCQNHTDCAEGGYCTRQDHTDYTGFGDCRPCARADYKYSIGSACDAMNNDCCSASFQATCPTAPLQCEDGSLTYKIRKGYS
eukprot:g1736.t1